MSLAQHCHPSTLSGMHYRHTHLTGEDTEAGAWQVSRGKLAFTALPRAGCLPASPLGCDSPSSLTTASVRVPGLSLGILC